MRHFVIPAIVVLALVAIAAASGCADPKQAALNGTTTVINTDLEALAAAATALQDAAPAADADGWNAASDAAAVDAMRAEWAKARTAYERVEGAIAVLFPDLDAATDERYDGFIAEGADDNLFDGEGVTGVHAIERILWAGEHPAPVVAFESGLTGYTEAATPATEAEAAAFKDELLQRLVDDTAKMRDDFASLQLDEATAYRGLIGSMAEQVEKVLLAGSGEDESRYAQYTLADMRANADGGKDIFENFRAWLDSSGGADDIAKIDAAFGRLDDAYAAVSGDSIPTVPETWNPDAPSAEDLATPYGQLFSAVNAEADFDNAESLVTALSDGGDRLGIPQLPE
jgi:iron uptake system component EfeO